MTKIIDDELDKINQNLIDQIKLAIHIKLQS